MREHLERTITPEAQNLIHPIMRRAADDAIDGVREGSFFNRVLAPLKGFIPTEIGDKVNQVPDYRNWIAHGK